MLRRTAAVLLVAGFSAAAQTGWQKHVNPAGFELDIPNPWHVETGSNGFVTVSSPDERSFVQVIPILARRNACPQLLQESFRVPSRRMPDAHVDLIERGRDNRSALADISFAGGTSRAIVLCSETSSRSAMVYTMAAPRGSFSAQRPGLLHMLTSFHYRAAASSSLGASRQIAPNLNLQFTRWTDPREGGFSLEVPAGWQANGGVRRYSNIEINAGVRIASPDGNTVLIINDDRLRRCITPYAGIRSGTNYGGSVFLNYVPAPVFVQQYIQMTVLRDAGARLIQVIGVRPRPDLSAVANQQFARYNANPAGATRAQHAEIEFIADRNGQRLAGYLLAETYITPSGAGGGDLWGAAVFGLMAPQEQMTGMMRALVRIAGSAQVNAQWAQSTQAAGRATQEAFHQAAQEIDHIITSSYWARQTPARRSENGERRLSWSEKQEDAMLGQVHLSDGEGTEYTAPSGSNYYWYHPEHDVIVGKDEPTPPNIDVRQLEIMQ